MTQTVFKVEKRADEKAKKLRERGLVPGNIFGGDGSISVQMNAQEFRRLYDVVGETGLIYLEVMGQKNQHPALIEEIQSDPVDDALLHVSFKQVDLTDKITAYVPVETLGKFELPEAVLVVVKDEIEVEALPTDFPEKFEVDVSSLTAIGQMITYKDLKYDRSKVTLVMGEEGEEEPVVIVQEQQQEVEEPVVVPAEGEAGVDGEGDASTEGEVKPGEETEKPAENAEPAEKK